MHAVDALIRRAGQVGCRSQGPSGDLVHHPGELGWGPAPTRGSLLATDLLHHPLEADGVGDGPGALLRDVVLRSTWRRRESIVWTPQNAASCTIRPHPKTDPMGLVPMVKQVCG